MEGARWDIQQGIITESRLKELFPVMPVVNIRVSDSVKDRVFTQGILCVEVLYSINVHICCARKLTTYCSGSMANYKYYHVVCWL
jgi:hypothetical protein